MRSNAISTLVLAVAAAAPCAGAAASPTAGRVLVVYNSAWTIDGDGDGTRDSEQVARYYAQVRGIPEANVLGVACTTPGTNYYYYTGQWGAFHDEMVAPIKARLDALGPTAIDVICLCYGIPNTVITPTYTSGVCIDNALMGLNRLSADPASVGWSSNPYFEPTPGVGSDLGHFDHAAFTFNGGAMYLVRRIDG